MWLGGWDKLPEDRMMGAPARRTVWGPVFCRGAGAAAMQVLRWEQCCGAWGQQKQGVSWEGLQKWSRGRSRGPYPRAHWPIPGPQSR